MPSLFENLDKSAAIDGSDISNKTLVHIRNDNQHIGWNMMFCGRKLQKLNK
jgi:hypothetical protein